ncbi:MAG: glycosyl transferase, partial [Cyanobacteria bacterium SW_4_48_29]
WFTQGWSLLLWSGYPVQTYRIYRRIQQRGLKSRDALLYAFFCMLGKFPNLVGQVKFYFNNYLGTRNRLIEYKG